MKVKYLVGTMVLIGVVGMLAACGREADSGSSASSSSESSESSQSFDKNQAASEVLIGKVKEATADEQRLVLASLIPEDKDSKTVPFDEVVLLTEGVEIVDSSDKEVTLDQINAGDTIEVTLIENSPIASSLPPQIPGMAIVKIVVP